MLFAQLGLMIGVNGAGWLIPFNDNGRGGKRAVVVLGYQGLIDLCYRSDRVESVCADVVCENDIFEFEQGLQQRLSHKPNLRGERGEPYAVYAIANIKGSSRPVYVVLNKSEVMKVKDASPASRKSDSPWNGKFKEEMWKKTALRRITKLLPKSVDLINSLEFENRQEEELKEAEAKVVDDPLADGRHVGKRGRSSKLDAAEKLAALEPTPEELVLKEPPPERTAVTTTGLPADYCDDYAALYKFQYERKQVNYMARAIEKARENHPECEKIKEFSDISATDETQCGCILTEFQKVRDASLGK